MKHINIFIYFVWQSAIHSTSLSQLHIKIYLRPTELVILSKGRTYMEAVILKVAQ